MAEQKEEKMTRAQKSALTREKIISTGFELLKEYGYSQLTVRNICERAQVSTGSFYHFYKSKDDLMSEFLKTDEWADLMKDPDDIVEYIIFGYKRLIDSYEKMGLEFVANFYTANNQSFNYYTRTAGGFASDLIKPRLIRAREEGYVRNDLPIDQMQYEIQVIVIGNIFQWCVVKGAIDIRLNLDHMLREHLLTNVITEKYKITFNQSKTE